jgi:hypothetical protein
MSRNKDNNSYVFPRIDPFADNIRSEAAKEFGIDGPKKNGHEGVSKNVRRSAESQMSGVPVYTKQRKKK